MQYQPTQDNISLVRRARRFLNDFTLKVAGQNIGSPTDRILMDISFIINKIRHLKMLQIIFGKKLILNSSVVRECVLI